MSEKQPDYVLKTNIRDQQYHKGKQPFPTIRIIVWVIVAVIILGSFIFGENLFLELSWTTRGILICLIISSFVWGTKTKYVPGNMEIRFYDDYFIIYKEKVCYSLKLYRKEYWKFQYYDVTKWEYDYSLKRLDLIGNTEAIWFDYNNNGTVPKEPTYHRYVEGGICYFYVWGDDAEKIVSSLKQVLIAEPVLKKVEYKLEEKQKNCLIK